MGGVLLHPTSLPGEGGQGDLGPAAETFVDYLASAGCRVWQMLPVAPVNADRSPYLPRSTFACHTGLLSAARLREAGLLSVSDLRLAAKTPYRQALVDRACRAFLQDAGHSERRQFDAFCSASAGWLNDYALFRVLARTHGDAPWPAWPERWRQRDPDTLAAFAEAESHAIAMECCAQYLFQQQWDALREYARRRDLTLFGDLPFYVALDSADVWAHRSFFRVADDGSAEETAGVPPDAFAAEGQGWGNPLYAWEQLAADGFRWWIDRLQRQCALFDMLRVDHFRGFESYWAIAGSRSPAEGSWRPGWGDALFSAVAAELGPLRLVAEDLGAITPEVEALRQRLGFPGMRVLQFGFEGLPDNPHRPCNHVPDAVAYTGTHDNDTTLGWWHSLSDPARSWVLEEIGKPDLPMPQALVAATMQSVARLAVVPMQDLLGLDSAARMNVPGTALGNWRWQVDASALDSGPPSWLRSLLADSERLASGT